MAAESPDTHTDPQSRTPARRHVYLIDREYQLREVSRGILMFMSLIFVQILFFIGVAYCMRVGKLDNVTGPTVFVAVAFAVPMLMCMLYSWITVRRTHRVAGAAYRLVQDIRHVVEDPGFRFRLREGDYLQEIAVELNKVMARIEAQQAELEGLIETLGDLRSTLEPIQAQLPAGTLGTIQAHLDDLEAMASKARLVSPVAGKDGPA